MYYVVYGLLYLVSLLPLRVLYLLSDFAWFIIYRVKGYRKAVVMHNLAIAFPEKTEAEREKIARQFYRQFTDTFIESIKLISMSEKQAARRSQIDIDYINQLIEKGHNIHIMVGHQFNWEFANIIYARRMKIPFVGVYAPIGNKIFDRIFYKTRSRYGTILISTRQFTGRMHHVFASQYVLGLAADQNPSNASRGYWLRYFGQPAPFVTGPAKGAVKNNTAVVFVGFERIKRGYYAYRTIPITEEASAYTPEQLTVLYKQALEKFIRQNPSNYLWTHRRWRHEWQPEYGPVIEDDIVTQHIK
ncbi:MAG: lysophospholipid acyltransferase family protein [Chitinophagaceae bacterium]|nr:lysophospholipid acyltransferase family protein [Chitinophagaceae bacterium]